MRISSTHQLRAIAWGVVATAVLGALIIVGSRRLDHFDAALVGYTSATLFATFAITYRYSMWLQRPPTRLYWRRGWETFLAPRLIGAHLRQFTRRVVLEFAANRFIFRRRPLRGLAHWLIMWGCLLAAAITFPLVWGWVHFETVPGHFELYRAFLFGFPVADLPVDSWQAFLAFHGLVWASLLVIAGVMLAFRRRMVDHGAMAVQQFGMDLLPLLALFAISVTGLMLTASYTWMHGYAYAFLAILHAITVIFTLLWLPFGKFFHIFQRPAQLGVSFYKDAGVASGSAVCARCGQPYASTMMVRDLITVERDLGFTYELPVSVGRVPPSGHSGEADPATHYQQICPRCRRALFGLAQGALWQTARRGEHDGDDSR
jgi:hypothetical protein